MSNESSMGSAHSPFMTNDNQFFPQEFIDNYQLYAANSQNMSSIPCATPIIGQKRLTRRGTSSSSFSNSSKQSSPVTNSFPSDTTGNCDLVSTSNLTETRHILNGHADSNLLLSNSMSTLSKNMSLNSPTSGSPTPSVPASGCKVIIPKSPKPQRTLAIFECVIVGLNLSLNDLRTKVADLTSAVTNGYNAMAKQLLQSESYLRHLEQRISTLLKLQNSYTVHLKMKDGIQNMYEAYKKSPGNQKSNLANIKLGWKDCIQKLCAIEAQTEALLGTFQFQIEKLIGFARLCPGDTYELLIKYGTGSKFRTRTKIGKDGSQTWDCSKFSFKITVQDLLLIRINEIKFLGKNLLIGERICDTRDLFSTTQTQRLTLNANISGTLKLSMLITWLPFENCEESFIYYNPTQYLTMNNKEKRLSSYTMTKLASAASTPSPTNTNTLPNSFNRLTDFTSLQVNTNYTRQTNVLSAITDNGDNDFDPSAASSSSSSTSSSSSNSKKINANNEPTGQRQVSTLSSSNSSMKLDSKATDSATNSSSNLDENHLSFCSSQSNLSNSASSNANTSHTSHEDFHVFSDVEKCLDSILTNLDDLNKSTNQDPIIDVRTVGLITDQRQESKCSTVEYSMREINLVKLVEDLFGKLQYRLDQLRSQYIELNELYEQTQDYEILIQKLVRQGKSQTIAEVAKNEGDTCEQEDAALDDVMQYFDFLDEESEVESSTRVSAQQIRSVLVEKLPSDFNHFLIRHFSHCIQLMDDLKFLNKHQAHTHFQLQTFESLIFEKLQTETHIMKSFLSTLVQHQTTDINAMLEQILNESLTTSDSSKVWLSSISISENLNDKCILNAEKHHLLRTLNEAMELTNDHQILNVLMNKVTHCATIPPEEDMQHTSISVYHFCAVQNLIMKNRQLILRLDDDMTRLASDCDKWVQNYEQNELEMHLKERVFAEIILGRLIQMVLNNKNGARQVTESFIDKMVSVNLQLTVKVVTNLTMETLFNLRNKANHSSDLKVLQFLIDALKKIRSNSTEAHGLIDATLIEFINVQISNQSAELL